MKIIGSMTWALLIASTLMFLSNELVRTGIVRANELSVFYVYEVPYVRQNDTYWCGPASLTMVLNYWGVNVTQEEVAVEIYDPATNLTHISEMRSYPQEHGFKTEELNGSINHLKKWISKGSPLIVLQKFSLQNAYGHYRVIVGYDDEKELVITFDPILGSNYNITYTEFTELWKPGSTFQTCNWTLLAIPKNNLLTNLVEKHQLLLNQRALSNDEQLMMPEDAFLIIVSFTLGLLLLTAVVIWRIGFRYGYQILLIDLSIFLAFTEIIAIARLWELQMISETDVTSTLTSILTLLGPLLGIVGGFTAFLYKDLDDRRMSLEESLLRNYSNVRDESQEAVRDQIEAKISEIKSELNRVKTNIWLMFSFFLAAIVSCFYNKDYVPEYLETSAIRILVPEGFLLVGIISIILLIISFHIPEAIDPSQGVNRARRFAPSDPYGSIIRSFLAVEEATRDFLAYKGKPVIRFISYSRLQNTLSKLDEKLGKEFGNLRKIRNNVVHGRTIPDVELAQKFNKRAKEYLKMLKVA